jgi:GMP synthase (glutamine-hydrolysing)
MTRPRVVIVQNSAGSGPGRLPAWLVEEQIDPILLPGADLPDRFSELVSVTSRSTAESPTQPGVDAMVLLGGGFMPDDDERAPFLPRERALVAEVIDGGVPVLGICLGAQLLALVAGGEVTAQSGETERGSCPVELLPPAADDALFAPLARNGDAELRMIQNHEDSITALPPGAVHLATSAACRVQAFRVEESAWGVQFHPEAHADRPADWNEAKLAEQGYDGAALVAQAEADGPVNRRQARTLVAAFADVVRERARS